MNPKTNPIEPPGGGLTGAGDHDDLPAFLEWVADELVRRDTRVGNFTQGLSQSLKGRAKILRMVPAPPTDSRGAE